jgi:chemosensory pili system protein ChpA (sensor histidine kinase/response regulator)
MARTVDKEVLLGFIEEARGYLPSIWEGLDALRADPDQPDVMEEVHRHVHTIKGAASMVGLSGLSHIAYHVEEALEEVSDDELSMSDEVSAFLRRGVAAVETYLDGLSNDTLRERPLLEEVTRAYRRIHGLPEEEKIEEPEAKEAETAPPAAEEQRATPAEELRSQEDVAPELVEAFYLEAEDHLRNISTRLAALDKDPDQSELLQDVRRSVHTLKGAAAMVGFPRVTQLAHRMEDLLDALYEDGLTFDREVMSLLFRSADALDDLTGGSVEGIEPVDIEELYAQYEELLGQTPTDESAPEPSFELELGEESMIDLAELGLWPEEDEDEEAGRESPRAPRKPTQVVRVPIERLDQLVNLVSELVITRTTFEQRMGDFERVAEELQFSLDRLRRVSSTLETEYEVRALGNRVRAPAEASVVNGPGVELVNRDTHGFDALEFDRYTEFHLLSRELAETVNDVGTVESELRMLIGDFDSTLNRQSRLSSELQEKLMRARMVPLATLSTRLHRAVRVLSREQGKLVDLELEGEQIELDKTVLEEMADPLLHLLRNAVDHGIEPPALRQVMGKPERGTIHLHAYHQGNQVVIQVRDDGSGLEPQAIRSVAVKKGYISEADAEQMPDEELYSLVFLPGFSTAGAVSEVSGRGVGLDVVRTNVHKLKGSVSLDATPGEGTTFAIRLPMTLAITRALLVRAHGETFAIPLNAVTQLLRLEREEIERVGQEPVVRVNDQVYPLHRLGRVLSLPQPSEVTNGRLPVLVVNTGEGQIALAVDDLVSGREIVVKTLGSHLRRVHGVAGATLMGDGSVVLILNPAELVAEPEEAKVRRWSAPQPAPSSDGAWQIMVVDDSVSVRSVISNLIENTGWRPVTAKDGLEALEIIQHAAEPPDLILLDIEMPRMDGYELMAALKAHDAYRDIPVVMLTSRAAQKHRRKALELGAAGYVTKPYQDEKLVEIIRNLVRTSRNASR